MKEPFVIWITGLPASGKSTIAKSLIRSLREKFNIPVVHLESDELRSILTPDATYSNEDRNSFYRIIADLAILLSRNGVNVIIDATANRRSYRERARDVLKNFIEVYVKCPLEVCIQRDPKGIYRKAKEGVITSLPGIQDAYEEPASPDVIIECDKTPPEEAIRMILGNLKENDWISDS